MSSEKVSQFNFALLLIHFLFIYCGIKNVLYLNINLTFINIIASGFGIFTYKYYKYILNILR